MVSLASVRSAVLVMAHPDDETLWCGGLLAATSTRIDWTVVCCTIPARDPVRAGKLTAACRALGVRNVHLIERTEPPAREQLPPEHMAAVGEQVGGYGLVLTHGPEGEYGHVHHRQISEYVRGLCPNAATTGYGAEGAYVLALTVEQHERKMAALRCYDHVLPYEGVPMTKWAALLKRYSGDYDLWTERYRGICD